MENTTPKLGIIESDPWLEPYSAAIEGRHQHALDKELELTGGKGTLSDFATGYLYFGLHRTRQSIRVRIMMITTMPVWVTRSIWKMLHLFVYRTYV